MAYWIFKCNPEKYRLAERLADPEPVITWNVTRYASEMKPGDVVFLWETGPNRGIRAVAQIEAEPEDMPELESEHRYWVEPDREVRCRVRATLVDPEVSLSADDLWEVPGLADLSVFRGFQQATNFRVTPDEGALLLRLVEGSRKRSV